MVNLKVELGDRPYPLFIGTNILGNLGEVYRLYGYSPRVVLITNLYSKENSYFNIVVEMFKKQGIEAKPLFLTDQQVKDGLATVQQVALDIANHGFQAEDTIIALGGSRIAHISAFIAQVIYGGVTYIQIPTTLTAQIVTSTDPISRLSSDSLSNLFEISYDHSLVWTDVALLKSLPGQNLLSGFSNIIQSACYLNNGFFEVIENSLDELLNLNLDIFEDVVFRCCQARVDFLGQNRSQRGSKKQYNFGEFVASILMEASQDKMKWGEALFLGLLIEGAIAFKSGVFNRPDFERFYELLKRIPVHHFIDHIKHQNIIDFINHKFSHRNFPMLHLPQEFGEFIYTDSCKLPDLVAALELVRT